MNKPARVVLWLALTAVGLLAIFSIAGAFWGAEKARQFFNSVPLKIYWYVFALLFVIGFVEFPRLLRRPSSLLTHAGCLLVLIGGMLGSPSGHHLAKRFLDTDKIPEGFLVIYEGQSENRVVSDDFKHILGQLPFSIKLNDFRLEYYEADEKSAPKLNIETPDGNSTQIVARAGEEMSLGQGRLKVVRTFANFRIQIEKGEKKAIDDKSGSENPAVEVEIAKPDGTSYKRYVFERFAGHGADESPKLTYTLQGPRMPKDYFSDLVVIKDGKEVLSKTIEVNCPLHYEGYHFYQHSYDSDAGQYTILSVTSDSGLYTVYAGYWLLSLGIIWQFWLRPVLKEKSAAEV